MRRLVLALPVALVLLAFLAASASAQIITYAAPLPVVAGGTGSTIGGLTAGSAATIGFASTAAGGGTCDTCLTRAAANILALNSASGLGQLRLPNGTVSVPSLTFGTATTTGIWSQSADIISFAVGGVNRWAITSSTLQTGDDNGTDIGSASTRVRTGYFGTSIRGGAAGVLDLGAGAEGINRLFVDYTNTGTVGNVTINKAAMRVNIAAAGTTITVTNSLVTAASHVFCLSSTADTTARVTDVVPGAGSFVMRTVATTAQTSFDCVVVNAD